MKKQYVKPAIEIVAIDTEMQLLAGSGIPVNRSEDNMLSDENEFL